MTALGTGSGLSLHQDADLTPPSARAAERSSAAGRIGSIDRHAQLSTADFFREYFVPGKPVILGGLQDDWPARAKWSFGYFRERFGDIDVNCGRSFDKSSRMKLARYLDYVADVDARRVLEPAGRAPLQLEGWYFRRTHPELARDYSVPAPFANDWWDKFMPERWDPKATALLMGPRGTFTKLHRDLACTHSWNAQVRGTKRWLFVSPDQAANLYLETRQSSGYFPGTDVDAPDLARYPKLAHVRWTEDVVHAGETVFFPRGWFHQVTALEPSISLTHNYVSGNNCVAGMSAFVLNKLGWKGI